MRGVDRVFKIKGSLCIITPIEYVLYCVVVQWRFVVAFHKDGDFVAIEKFWGDSSDG